MLSLKEQLFSLIEAAYPHIYTDVISITDQLRSDIRLEHDTSHCETRRRNGCQVDIDQFIPHAFFNHNQR